MAQIGTTAEEMAGRGNHALPIVVAIVGAILTVTVIAILVQLTGAESFVGGLIIGALVAVGLVLAPMATGYIFEGRPLKLYIINAAENTISLHGHLADSHPLAIGRRQGHRVIMALCAGSNLTSRHMPPYRLDLTAWALKASHGITHGIVGTAPRRPTAGLLVS